MPDEALDEIMRRLSASDVDVAELPAAIEVELNGVEVPWYVDSRYVKVFKGEDYGYRCLCAIGPRGTDRVTFADSKNPRHRVYKIAKHTGLDIVVTEALWLRINETRPVLAELRQILAQARQIELDGWYTISRHLIRPLLLRAAERAGIEGGMFHETFSAHILGEETFRLRARLKRSGLEPDIADRYVVVSQKSI